VVNSLTPEGKNSRRKGRKSAKRLYYRVQEEGGTLGVHAGKKVYFYTGNPREQGELENGEGNPGG